MRRSRGSGSKILQVVLTAAVPVVLMGMAAPHASAATPQAELAASAGSSSMASMAGSEAIADCVRSGEPTAAGYASGAECPPVGFEVYYLPVIEMTKAGPRAMDPYTDGCSNVRDTGLNFNFKDACATHDYLADLQRFGAEGVSEPGMDHQFLLDMKADCKKRNILARADCESMAYTYRAGVQQGNYSSEDRDEIDRN